MFSRSSIPNDVLKTLVCSKCSNYLSVLPIYMTENSGVLCGRCKVPDQEKLTRYEAFESISQYILFPCMYFGSGCDYSMTPTEMKEHELFCDYRQFIDCPTNTISLECQWKGAKSEMVQHFKENHDKLILEEPSFKVNFLISQKEHLLLQQNDEWFIINNEVDSRKCMFSCSIEHIKMNENSQTPNYFLYIQNANKDHCHKCPEKSTSDNEMLNSTHVTFDMLHEPIKDSSAIIIDVQLILDAIGEGQKKPDIKKVKNSYGDVLFELKCPVCARYMLPPIFQCIDGHSICHLCKVEVDNKCPVCRNRIEETRNFVLEQITKHVKYPCIFHEFGCKYSCKPTYIKEHEEYCEFQPFICPLNNILDCYWKDNLVELLAHIENDHKDFIFKNGQLNMPLLDKPLLEVYLIKLGKTMFKLCYRRYRNLKKACWYVEYIGTGNRSKNYKFTVDITDLSNSVTYCYITGVVQPHAQKTINFKQPPSHGNYLVLYNEQLEAFPTELSFRITVIKDEKYFI